MAHSYRSCASKFIRQIGGQTVPGQGIPTTGAPTMSPFSRRQFLGRSLAALGGATLAGPATRAGTRQATTLRELADARWLWLGPAVGYNQLQNDPTYRAVLAQEF